jgi:hypothetical protein
LDPGHFSLNGLAFSKETAFHITIYSARFAHVTLVRGIGAR